jgi:hypothetical protein
MLKIIKNLGSRMNRINHFPDLRIKESSEFDACLQQVEREICELDEQRGCQNSNDLCDWFMMLPFNRIGGLS